MHLRTCSLTTFGPPFSPSFLLPRDEGPRKSVWAFCDGLYCENASVLVDSTISDIVKVEYGAVIDYRSCWYWVR
jgi:hypothetical protein